MGKKKKKKSGSSLPQEIAERLMEGEPGKLSSRAGEMGLTGDGFGEVFERASGLAQKGGDPREVVKLPSQFQAAFLLLAEQEEDEDQLNDLINLATDKSVKKEAKRVVHRMRSRGLDVAYSEDGRSSILERRIDHEEPELPCYLTPVSGNGMRMIWLARYVRGGVAVYQAEVSDTEGLLEFSGGVIGRSRYRTIDKEVSKREEVQLVTISYAEARRRVAKAVALSRETSRALPEGYLEASSSLPEVEEVKIPDPREGLGIESLGDLTDLRRKAAELHELAEFADWVPGEESLEDLRGKFQEIETGKVAINAQQKVDQVSKALDDMVTDMLEGEEKKELYQNRLFEMAAHLEATGSKEAAAQTAAVAWHLDDEDFTPLDSPFFVRLVRKMFRNPEEIVEQMSSTEDKPSPSPGDEGDKGNLIVPP